LAYVSVPKDLSKVKTKVMFNLTKRQLFCFGTAAAIGAPVFFITRGIIGNSSAVMVMIVLMLPAFFAAMYEKDGMPAEKLLLNIVRAKWYYPPLRPYKNENFYHAIEMEGKLFVQDEKTASARGTLAGERKAGEKDKERL
jgi:hypothetical protein